MSDAVVVALISGGLTLLGTVFTVVKASSKTEANIKIHQAVTDEKIENLTREVREVREHNFAQRVPVIEEQIKVVNHRISDIENRLK